MNPNLLYRILKVYCTVALKFYFKRWDICNVKSIPAKGPVIFIPNHQNAFLDAILIICSSPRNPWSIARASVFKKGWVTKLLTAIQIKPVFRIRDGWSSLRNNDTLIQEWSDMLAQGEDILIFAEGNHNEPYASGVLQKGFARMTIQFQEKNKTPLTIVPIGLHYDDHHAFRSRVLINFGDPIYVNDLLKEYLSEREKLETLIGVTDQAIKKLTLAIKPDEEYQARFNYLLRNRKNEKDMIVQLESDRKTLTSFPLEVSSATNSRNSSSVWKFVNPIVWIGYILHFIPYSIIRNFVKKKVKDPQFKSSVKYALGIFLVPLYYCMIFAILTFFIPVMVSLVVCLFILPFTGIAATDFLKR